MEVLSPVGVEKVPEQNAALSCGRMPSPVLLFRFD